MISTLKRIKSLVIGIFALSFLMCVSLSACNTNKKSEKTEEASEAKEHPTGGEHPTNTEEHPSDSTKQENPKGEHPKSDEKK